MYLYGRQKIITNEDRNRPPSTNVIKNIQKVKSKSSTPKASKIKSPTMMFSPSIQITSFDI